MTNIPRLLWFLQTSLRRLHWNKTKLERYQLKKLRSVIHYAQSNVPFYHDLFKQAGVFSADIRTLDDLSKFPIVNKAMMRKYATERLVSKEYSLSALKAVTSSGSSGNPFYVYISGRENDWRKAIYMRANISCGQRPRDCWAVVTGPRHFFDTTKMQRVFGIFAQQVISIYDDIPSQVNRIRRINPDVLDGYSQDLLLVAKRVHDMGITDIRPRLMFGSAELISEPERRFMEKVFNAPFHDQFGCSEIDRSAWQCPERRGYHLDMDSVTTQFVDENGDSVGSDETGSVVYTSLFNYAMPLIRYSVGDVGQSMDDDCVCGRVLPLMKVVEGRKDSVVVLPKNVVVSPLKFYWIMNEFVGYSGIEQYRVVQKRVDRIELLVKVAEGVDIAKLRDKLTSNFKNSLSLDALGVDFDIAFVEELPRMKGGKLASVVSEVNMK